MQKPDPKGNGEFHDPIIREGVTRGSNEGTKEGKGLQKGTHDSEIQGPTGKRVEDKVAITGKTRSQTLRALATSRNVHCKDVRDLAPATSNSFKFEDDGFHRFEMDSIPVSGYTTFQQRDFSLLYFYFSKQLFKVKAQADQLSVQPTMIWQGSLSKGPFPFYEEIPLIKMLVMSSKAKYCDDYVPVAHANTNIPLTVSP